MSENSDFVPYKHRKTNKHTHTHTHRVVLCGTDLNTHLYSELTAHVFFHWIIILEPWICVASCRIFRLSEVSESEAEMTVEILLLMTAGQSHNWLANMSLSVSDVSFGAGHWFGRKESTTSIIQPGIELSTTSSFHLAKLKAYILGKGTATAEFVSYQVYRGSNWAKVFFWTVQTNYLILLRGIFTFKTNKTQKKLLVNFHVKWLICSWQIPSTRTVTTHYTEPVCSQTAVPVPSSGTLLVDQTCSDVRLMVWMLCWLLVVMASEGNEQRKCSLIQIDVQFRLLTHFTKPRKGLCSSLFLYRLGLICV